MFAFLTETLSFVALFQVRVSWKACHSFVKARSRKKTLVRSQGQEAQVKSQRQQPKNFAGNELGIINCNTCTLSVF